MEYITISEVNEIVKLTLENEPLLKLIYVKGEISNIKYHSRGHIYFSLKDENSKINAVMFNAGGKLSFNPKDGDSVLVTGRINVYPGSGSYQINVFNIEPDGIGNLYVLFEQLKKKLCSEGLFDSSHKRKIPKLPEKIGIITAKEGAAVKDIITTINRRYPLCEIYLFPSLVQGIDAKDSIVKMIKKANETDIDVLIVGRGGGSIEDLWAFNEEIVARAIYESKIPVVSAVGHEIDYTIADFVADLRAPTPTAAAELVVKNREDIESYLSEVVIRLDNALINKIEHLNEKLNKFKTNYILNNPNSFILNKKSELEKVNELLNIYLNNNISSLRNKYEMYKLKLDLLNPLNILDKGYSIIKSDNKIIKDVNSVNILDKLEIVMKNGKINAVVEGVNNGK